MTAPKSICVYCGSSGRVDDRYKNSAHSLGDGLGRRGLQLVYGGGRVGLMGIVADATLAAGGRAVGIIPEHLQTAEVEHPGLTEVHVVDSMHTRKRMMVERSDAFVVLPGGLGTLDETFEILTWRQLRLHDKPVVLINIDNYWTPLLAAIEHMIGERFVQEKHRDLFRVVDCIEDVFDVLALAPPPKLPDQSELM